MSIATWWFAFILVVIAAGLYLALTHRAPWWNRQANEWGTGTRYFLVVLRLAIGWHLLFEGMAKVNDPNWSSEPYLRESIGPLAPVFRTLAGDSVAERLTVGPDNAFPAALDKDWRAYLEYFEQHYQLDAQQKTLAEAKLDQAKAQARRRLTTELTTVRKPSTVPPALEVTLTIPERLKEYKATVQKVRAIEAKDRNTYGRDAVFEELRVAKAERERQRNELRAELVKLNTDMHQALYDAAVVEPKRLRYGVLAVATYSPVTGLAGGLAVVPSYEVRERYFFPLAQDLPAPLPERPVLPPWTEWSLLQWSNFLVKWGLVICGGALLVGVLTGAACLGGALLVLSFYLAYAALPDWPESPRLEGHYLYVNKTLIEVFALLALATTRSGRWFGLDALLQFFRPSSWRAYPPRQVGMTRDRYPAEAVAVGAPHSALSPAPKEIRHGT
jgi:uncharacterized membrane protein YphA (DoxX/SURF4 family)